MDKAKRNPLVLLDPWLAPYEEEVEARTARLEAWKAAHVPQGMSLRDFANGHQYFGFHQEGEERVYREWAPGARALCLVGDFNSWDPYSHPLHPLGQGVFELRLPLSQLPHGSLLKVRVEGERGVQDRIPLYIHRVVQDPLTLDFRGQLWDPPQPYAFRHENPDLPPGEGPLIYEAHPGMALEAERVGTWKEFGEEVLPRIRKLGYNVLQLMAVMEHPYYGSFGYHVSNFFAASSRFGTPEDLKELVDMAHGMGILVLMDLVHSHSVKNQAEGIAFFDGTQKQFFHPGPEGEHPAWDSMLFDYGKGPVSHFLLSSLKYFLEEFRFDGFRFDGVTSMLYRDHGLGVSFDSYGKYFGENLDEEALIYLQCATSLVREIRSDALLVAEEMSGLPGVCRPVAEGGLGFGYRLAMGIPDFWVRTLKHQDQDWNLEEMVYALTTARPGEKQITYVESHDQALVGDKTFIFRLADQEMYWHMGKGEDHPLIHRALSLHKMARLITATMGGEGYLNFMGNEFGHPEWVDFPREGNGWSHAYCRRQWHLADDPGLRYGGLQAFDQAMIALIREGGFHGMPPGEVLWTDRERLILAYRRGGHLFAYNFHPFHSYPGLCIPTHEDGVWEVVLDTDREAFEGQGRIAGDGAYAAGPLPGLEPYRGLQLYLPARTAMVLKKADSRDKGN